jgi:hypothetical protein
MILKASIIAASSSNMELHFSCKQSVINKIQENRSNFAFSGAAKNEVVDGIFVVDDDGIFSPVQGYNTKAYICRMKRSMLTDIIVALGYQTQYKLDLIHENERKFFSEYIWARFVNNGKEAKVLQTQFIHFLKYVLRKDNKTMRQLSKFHTRARNGDGKMTYFHATPAKIKTIFRYYAQLFKSVIRNEEDQNRKMEREKEE